jgi:ribosome recycling factor
MMNEERRKELVKLVKAEAEAARVAARNVRRDANNAFKDALKAKMISEDEERRAQDELQKMTDVTIRDIDRQFAVKESELLSV